MRILIADDDHASRLVLRKAVERLGHECVQADDADHAFTLFQQIRPSAIICDWAMPGKNGLDLLGAVRAADDQHYTYFIISAAFEEKGRLTEALHAGADDFILKPVDRDELKAKLVVASRGIALQHQLLDARRQIEQQAVKVAEDHRRDPLTQIGNRLRMQEDLEVLAGRAVRYGHQFCVALCDLDHFKSYNDACGVTAGDAILKAVARTLNRYSRSGDMVYRYGGQQFLVVLPEQALEGAIIALERRRRAVERLAIPHPQSGMVTVSAGIAVFEPRESNPIDAVLRRAERSLKFAKENGRNRVATQRQVQEWEQAKREERPSQP
jgi:two-component system chemotaxis response regulator CheY